MPQLDISTFIPQLVWLALTFGALYLIMSRAVLPRISDVLEQRQDRIASDIEEAEKLKYKAEEIIKDYEETLEIARTRAQEILAENKKNMSEEITQQTNALDAQLLDKYSQENELMKRLWEEAQTEIQAAALEAAKAITSRLTNAEITTEEASVEVFEQLKAQNS